jgi:uncharacterized membrane protein YvbJ
MNKHMNKKNILAVAGILVVIVVVLGLWYYQKMSNSSLTDEKQALDALDKALSEDADVSSLDLSSNPAEKLPNTNPVDQTNPFKDLEVNPFK